ncbi:penicillin-binding protein 1C [Fretibacter rubidus]|uniref:penicillin-binding protein 1C n=1 Tax=Fretibacter rubidus TaxID=570162 RepID=UPI00352A32E4
MLGCLALLFALNIAVPPSLTAAGHVSSVVQDRDGRWLSGFTVEDGTWRIPADLDAIDPSFIKAVIAVEDKRFYDHSGVDPIAVIRAARTWLREGEAVSGASTITMQLIRQLEPRPRNLRSKVIETIRAVQIELWLSKDEILAAYLTHTPYGGNIEGVEAATRLYLGKAPDQLTTEDIALLIALPQSPEARRPDRNPKTAKAARNAVLAKLNAKGLLSAQTFKEASVSPLHVSRSAMPERAWITAYGLAERGARVTTTLDYDLQNTVEALAMRVMRDIESPTNIAVTIVDNRSMAVRAHLASSDRTRPGGWIDMTRQSRSPGSTLKPFIYGLAMDDGIISLGSRVNDAPTRFGNYRPENFDRRYHGQVRIDEALRHSLNVPAVAILDKIGGKRLEQSLLATGVDMTRLGDGSEQAGLALALGGAGLSVNDVAVLYAALANDGQARALRWIEDSPQSKAVSLVSPKTAANITKALRQSPTPSGYVPGWLSKNGVDIAYKTGTSYGFRDAWAAGYTDDWTVVVWVGRPDGAPRLGQTGRKAAAPILYSIFDSLPHRARAKAYQRDDDAPSGLTTVAALTGPQILFPPNGADIYAAELGADTRGFTLSATSDQGNVRFYVDAAPLAGSVWKPDREGFFTIKAVDATGQSASSRVRIMGRDGTLR